MSEENDAGDGGEFGDFAEVVEEPERKKSGVQTDAEKTQELIRVRMPRGKELVGVIAQRYGGNRMEVVCSDGKARNCRVPGKYKRALWLRPKDVVLIVPWVDDDSKGDIIFKYRGAQINQLRKRGFLDKIGTEF